ncbi:hypothetical protein BDF14DRAFT_1858580 [Spinellus fusiger]|nr:hypothetical protein BDF14DRAFT_1858580 [Spinellus fusiger]
MYLPESHSTTMEKTYQANDNHNYIPSRDIESIELPRLLPPFYQNTYSFSSTDIRPHSYSHSQQSSAESFISLPPTYSPQLHSLCMSTSEEERHSLDDPSTTMDALLEETFQSSEKPVKRTSSGKRKKYTRFVDFCKKWLGRREPEMCLTEYSPVWYSRFDSNPTSSSYLQNAVASY